MSSLEEKTNDFFMIMINNQTSEESTHRKYFFKEEKIKPYRHQSLSCPKNIKDHGFMKKYTIFCDYYSWVSSFRPIQFECKILAEYINQIYEIYSQFITKGWWKQHNNESYLQQFLIVFLDHKYHQKKRNFRSFDEFFLSFFYTLNFLKTALKKIKNFCNFLNGSLSVGQFFVYLCLRSTATMNQQRTMVNQPLLKKVIKIFQIKIDHEVTNSLFNYTNQTLSERSKYNSGILSNQDLQKNKKIDIQLVFQSPSEQQLILPKVLMFKIMKACQIIDTKQNTEQTISWKQFLGYYFDNLGCQDTSFEHLLSINLAKVTYQLSQKLITNQQMRSQFLEKAFAYVFSILEVIFDEHDPDIDNLKTKVNILTLKRSYKAIKSLNDYGITVLSRFTKKILKNNYILSLYREYNNLN